MKTQESTFRCDHCGRLAAVTPTQSPWEFDAECVCGRSFVLSHAHDEPPPKYVMPTDSRLPFQSGEQHGPE